MIKLFYRFHFAAFRPNRRLRATTRWWACILFMLAASGVHAGGFELIALGVKGGLDEGDLSSYLIRAQSDPHYLALDAGTLLPGIRQALRNGAFAASRTDALKPESAQVLHELIAGYFISHAHLDHVAGLLIAATDDTGSKPVYALASTNDALSRDYFNWSAWPNFADRGEPPALGRYRLTDEEPGQAFAVTHTSLTGTIYPLSHDRVLSSMLLLKAGNGYFAYFGDTGPDVLSHGHHLSDIWQVLGPLAHRHALKGLLIETSFPNDVPDKLLFGHLTPAWLLRELHALEQSSGGSGSLRGLPVIISHIKPSLIPGRDPSALVAAQLEVANTLGVHFVYLHQGEALHLP